MRKIVLAIALAAALSSSMTSAFAAYSGDCDSVPKSEWAQCIFDQSAEVGSE